MNWDLDAFSKLASIVGSLGIVAAYFQLRMGMKSFAHDHERSRRQKTVDLLMEWSTNLDRKSSASRRITESLNDTECRALLSGEQIEVGNKYRSYLEVMFDSVAESSESNQGKISLSPAQVSDLRWHLLSYLNSLESVLVAWDCHVVDRDVIENQFQYLLAPEEGQYALRNFRIAAGGANCYPAIARFEKRLVKLAEKNGKIWKDTGT